MCLYNTRHWTRLKINFINSVINFAKLSTKNKKLNNRIIDNIQNKKAPTRGAYLFGAVDRNWTCMELPTRSLVLRVCQFRHDRINENYYNQMFSICQLILSAFFKNFIFFAFFPSFSFFFRFWRIFSHLLTHSNGKWRNFYESYWYCQTHRWTRPRRYS